MNEAIAKKHLEPHLTSLRVAVVDGFEAYHREYASVSHIHSPRTRASTIHDHIVYNVKKISSSGIKFLPSKIRNLFSAGGVLVLQFKKLNSGLKPSNYPTQLALNFDAQIKTGYLPGMAESSPRMTVGFVPNIAFTSINGVYVVYLEKKKVIWSFEIPESDTGEDSVIQPAFAPPTPIVGRRVKPKKSASNDTMRNRDAQG